MRRQLVAAKADAVCVVCTACTAFIVFHCSSPSPQCILPLHCALQERIAELESEAMGERPWQLKGEVAAAQRPINSALEVGQGAAGGGL